MPTFLEQFVLPVLAGLVIAVIVLNPFKFDLKQQVALGIVTIALAYFVGHTAYIAREKTDVVGKAALQAESIPSSPASSPSEPVQQRSFTNKTARELLQLYEGRTMIQADGLMEPFKGQWIRVSGTVLQLIPDSSGATAVLKSQPNDTINARFDKKWDMSLRRLSTGEEVTIQGKIADVQNGQQLYLLDCEF